LYELQWTNEAHRLCHPLPGAPDSRYCGLYEISDLLNMKIDILLEMSEFIDDLIVQNSLLGGIVRIRLLGNCIEMVKKGRDELRLFSIKSDNENTLSSGSHPPPFRDFR
jgi:hypothetical protein